MKKLISVILLMAMVASLCACGKQDAQSAAPEETLDPMSPEAMYGHIDQSQLTDGVYQIWNAQGMQSLADHPDGDFKILCNIDMEGAVLAPIPEFTGSVDATACVISNFTLQGGSEENFGFFGVNKGKVSSFTLENVTFLPGENAKNIGAFAGINEGSLNRCVISGAVEVKTAAEDAACGAIAGVNTGSITNTAATVDVVYSAPGKANVGGLVGVAEGGTVEYAESHGVLTVTGSDKSTGLFAGEVTDTIFKSCVFGGADNSLDGKLFTNFTGNPEDDELVVAEDGRWRDNACIEILPENVQALRNKVVQTMYDMKNVSWKVTNDLPHSCTCQMTTCHGIYSTNYTYYGMPYNHKASSLKRFNYCLDENGNFQDWFYDLDAYDGFDIYAGADCSSTVQLAWWSVSNSTDIRATDQIMPAYGRGTVPVGDYKCDFKMTKQTRGGVYTLYTAEYLEANDEQTIYEAYADMHPGDGMVNRVATGGHTRMVSSEPVVVRDQQGNIDPVYSYVLMHDQGGEHIDDVNKTITYGKINWKFTFGELYGTCYLPVTCEELVTGEMEPVEVTLLDGCDGYGGMFSGTVQANYHIDAVTWTIKDAKGNTVLEHPMFVTAQKTTDYGNNYYTGRSYTDSYDLSNFAVVMTHLPLEQGQSYTYTITANLATFDDVVVHEGEFSYG